MSDVKLSDKISDKLDKIPKKLLVPGSMVAGAVGFGAAKQGLKDWQLGRGVREQQEDYAEGKMASMLSEGDVGQFPLATEVGHARNHAAIADALFETRGKAITLARKQLLQSFPSSTVKKSKGISAFDLAIKV